MLKDASIELTTKTRNLMGNPPYSLGKHFSFRGELPSSGSLSCEQRYATINIAEYTLGS